MADHPELFDAGELFRLAGDAIVVADAAGVVRIWNPAAERIFGYPATEAIGRTLDVIIPEHLRDRHWTGYRQVMQSGRTRYRSEVLRVPALHKDGRRLSIAFTVALLGAPEGPPRAIAAIVRDETARWEAEQALRRRVRELEGLQAPPAAEPSQGPETAVA